MPHTFPADAPTAALTSPSPLVPTEELITAHMPLVGHIVRETMGRVPAHVSRDDLTSAGMLALVTAARAFEPDRGVPFVGYAATRVRGAVLDELRRVDWASRSVRRRARDHDETRNRLAAVLGRIPTTAEVASALSVPVEEVTRNEGDIARASILSLEGSENADGPVVPSTGPTPAEVAEHRELLTYLVEAVNELPERLRVVVTEYFLAERPMAEIAADLGVTESRISQIRAEALVLLRTVLHRELDPELVEAAGETQGCAARRRESYYAAVAARHAVGLRRTATDRALDQSA